MNLVDYTLDKNGRNYWYPKVGTTNNTNFVFLDTLSYDNPKVYSKAKNLLSQTASEISGSLWPQMANLKALAEREKDKEDRLLDLFFDEARAGSSPRSVAERLQAFNKIYQNKKIFERNLQKIKDFEAGITKSGKIDVSSVFKEYLETELGHMNKVPLKQMNYNYFAEIVKKALVRMYHSADDRSQANNELALRSYEEFSRLIDNMSLNDNYIQEVTKLYFGNSIDEIKKQLQKSQGKKHFHPEQFMSKQKGLHGSVFELFNELVYDSLGMNSKHTGTSGQKADHQIIYSTEIKIELPDFQVGDSVREHFINQYQNFYNQLDKVSGQIVEISDKNYDLNSSWFKKEGFAAQSNLNINNFEKTLIAYGIDKKKVDNLIFALLNIGPDTITEDTTIIENNISSLIAYFLFDDIDMDEGLKVDAIHLFNLNGIYIPLSSFLFCAYEAFFEANYKFDGFIKTTYEPKNLGYEKQEVLVQQDWIDLREKKKQQNNLSIHFLQNFAKFVSEYL